MIAHKRWKRRPQATCALILALAARSPAATLQTEYASIQVDDHGCITSIASRQTGKEYAAIGHPSPLLSLHESGHLLAPNSAIVRRGIPQIELTYSNGAVAVVKLDERKQYIRLQLISLTPRGNVDNIVWGPINTSISKTVGDIIGVVRNDGWAIGMMGLDDNTIAGPPVDSDCYQMGYYIHSPDPEKYPLPPQYKEGQRFSVGGNGISDTAFYSHPEEYFQQMFGNGATIEPEFGSSLAYHARDRRRSYTYLYSLLPGFEHSKPRHQVSDPVDGVDFNGSAVALYGCPDDMGLHVIESIILGEGLPHPVIDGKWIRDPSSFKPDIAWSGPHDKLIEYADALGLKAVQDEGQGEYYANPMDHWQGKRVGFSGGRSMTYKEFTDQTNAHGIRYGLHTLCLFLQGGRCSDVLPIPSRHLQTVLRTKLAKTISATDTDITVTDPSFLVEKGTWSDGDPNILQIGDELLTYGGISSTAPYTLQNVKRGHGGTKPTVHQANEELVKLQINCYGGFSPDMKLLLDYADYYANVMYQNGMEYIDFDGLESTIYTNQGYYAVRCFYRRLFDTYSRLSGGRCPRVMGSSVFAGGWEYMSVCNVGGGNNMFDPINNRWGIEGKDIRNGFSHSYFPATFGIQGYHSDWSVNDAENLQAKSVGWDATYMLGLSQGAVEPSGEKADIFKAFRTWEDARASNVFSTVTKAQLRSLDCKFHLEQTGERKFVLYPIKEIRVSDRAGTDETQINVTNPYDGQPLQFALRVSEPVNSCIITLPGGIEIKSDVKMEKGQFILCKGKEVYLADKFRKKLTDLTLMHEVTLPPAESKIGVRFPGTNSQVGIELTVWVSGKSEDLGK